MKQILIEDLLFKIAGPKAYVIKDRLPIIKRLNTIDHLAFGILHSSVKGMRYDKALHPLLIFGSLMMYKTIPEDVFISTTFKFLKPNHKNFVTPEELLEWIQKEE